MSKCLEMLIVKINKKFSSCCSTCDNIINCSNELNIPFREWQEVRYKINTFNSNGVELLAYKRKVKVLSKCHNLKKVNREFKFIPQNKNNTLVKPIDERFTLQHLHRNIVVSTRRAYDNFFGYALSNNFDLFFTFTFSPKVVNRFDYDGCISLWTKFLKSQKRINPKLKAICATEQHENGAIHLHGFMANYDFALVPAEKNGRVILTRFGDIIHNVPVWKYGFATAIILPKDYNARRVANYCIAYVAKQGSFAYRKKKFFRTRNLDFKQKSFLDNEIDYQEFVKSLGLEKIKDTNRLEVWRG